MRTRVASLLTMVALALPASAHAQMPLPHPSFGLVGALNLSTAAGSDVSGAENRVGFSIGGFVRIPMSPMWSFQPELEYAAKGVKETDNSGGTPSTATIDLSYLEMPLLFRVSAPSSPAGQLFGEFGPAVAVKVDCSLSATSGGVSASTSCSNFGLDIKSLDFGAMVGAGYEFPMAGHALSLGVRYNFGLAEITSGSNAKNRNLQFVAGLRF